MLNTITLRQETDDQEEANTSKQLLADSDPEFPESLASIDPAILDMSTAKGSLNDHLQKLIQENQGISSTLQLSLSGYMPEQDQVFSADPATTDLSEIMNMLREHLPQASHVNVCTVKFYAILANHSEQSSKLFLSFLSLCRCCSCTFFIV